MDEKCPYKYNTREYKAWHSRKYLQNLSVEEKHQRHRNRTIARQTKKAEFVKRLGSKCVDCGGSFPDPVMEFHHVDPFQKKHRDVARLFMLSIDKIENEVNKCILLCANCHRIRHYNEELLKHK